MPFKGHPERAFFLSKEQAPYGMPVLQRQPRLAYGVSSVTGIKKAYCENSRPLVLLVWQYLTVCASTGS